jgi:RNA polymerase sigma factor (sigma-70 family)
LDQIRNIILQVKSNQITEKDAIQQLEYLWQSNISNHGRPPSVGTMRRALSPEEIMVEAENSQDRKNFLIALFDKLSPQYRRILYLYAVERLTMREIGDELGISKQAVCTYLKRIRKRARGVDRSTMFPIDTEINIRNK